MSRAQIPYYQKLKDPRWQKKRLEAMQATEFRCEVCMDDESTLNVHHKTYFKGREPWEYDIEQLAVLCDDCHKAEHAEEDPLLLVTSYLPIDGPESRQTITSLIHGLVESQVPISDVNPVAHMAGTLAQRVFLSWGNKALLARLVQLTDGPHGEDLLKVLADFAATRP